MSYIVDPNEASRFSRFLLFFTFNGFVSTDALVTVKNRELATFKNCAGSTLNILWLSGRLAMGCEDCPKPAPFGI
jgi:hypothetical protein